jgi:hydroxyethylthiazole kinase
LGRDTVKMQGVDSFVAMDEDAELASQLAVRFATTVVMSGAIDIIADANESVTIARGSEHMQRVTGTGCLLTAVVAAFNAVSSDRLLASSTACLFYALCGERAASRATGPGSFRVAFLDALNATPEENDYATH